jgi:Zinc carboxypeptidase
MNLRGAARMAQALVILVVLACSGWLGTGAAHQGAPSSPPSPEQFFGFRMGADRKLANWDKLLDYYRTLAKTATNMRLVELGKSSENRPYIALFISSPANLARLDRLRQLNARLADPRGLSEPEARKIVAEARAVVIQSFALHSSEVAASQTAAEYVFDSLTRSDDEAQRMLDNVISIVVPSINPDGTQMIADWYMEYVGTPHEAAGLPWLYQKYSGHDNNRDGFALNLPESQHLGRLMYRDWMPQAYVDHHQMGSGNARLYIPPYAEPIRPDGDPLVWREMAWWGAHMGNRLEAAGKTGVIGNAIYSGWGHMGFHWITPFHNIAGMLTESASARLATPMYIHPDQLRGGPRNLPEYEAQTNMPSVWPGGWWRVRDIVEQQKIAAWATVDLAARNREIVLWNMYLKGTRQTERGAKADVKAYVIPMPQHDALTARKLANMLLHSGVEVHQTTAQATIDGRVYGPGSYVVSMAQPKMGLVRWMLGRTFYPDNSFTRDREGNPIRPYDMATDTFAEFMGVRCDPLTELVTQELTKMTGPAWPAGTVAANAANGYVLSTRLNDAFRAVSLLLEKGATVRRVPSGAGFTPGDFIVTGAPPAAAAEVAKITGVDFATLSSAVPPPAYPLRKPRIAMYQRYGGGNMDEGWSRLMFEQFDIPVKPLMDAEIRKGDLNAAYDAIILPADSIAAMTGETPPGGEGGRGGRGASGGGSGAGSGREGGGTPPQYRSGFGAEGVKMLQAFVQKGGTLVTFGQAGDLPLQRFGLPVRNVVAGLSSKEFWSPGSTLRVRFDTQHPLAFGMPRDGYALFLAGSQAYEVTASDPGVEIVATFVEREILQSGWLLGEAVIARRAAAVTVDHGAGRVVLLGFRPQHRDQTHGTFKLVFNALFTRPPSPPPTSAQVR